MLSLEAISRGVGDRVLFEDIWWTIHPGDRIGLVGPNGSGKTTLLRILAGLDEADAGRVRRRRGLRVAYLPQEVEAEFAEGMSVLEAALVGANDLRALGREIDALADRLAQASREGDEKRVARLSEEYGERRALFEWFGGDQLEARARIVLGGLGFSSDAFDQLAGTLSGGWRMRVLMARMLLSGSDLLLLDEPTNHLDLDALAWLEDHLAGSPAAVIVVSHDRYFLDRVATRIADLVGDRLRVTTGGYSEWVRARTTEREQTLARDRQLAAEEQRLKRFVERFGYKATKASQANERKKMLENVRAQRRALECDSSWSWSIHWPPAPPSPELLISLEGVSKSFGELAVLDRVELQIRRGERLAILGPNGAGKTTLLRVLAGQLPPDRGRRHVAQGLVIGRFAQHQLETMDASLSVLEQAQRAAPGRTPEQVRKALGGLGLGPDHVGRPVGTLSGGERARLALARLLLHPSHLLMLDEPTNHLDLPMRQALEDALEAWEGTLLVVSHDRAFLERLTKAGIAVEGRCVERIDGSWQAWLDWRRDRRRAAAGADASGDRRSRPSVAGAGSAGERSTSSLAMASGASDADRRSRASRRERAEALQARQRRLRPLREAVTALEAAIESAEARLDALDRALSDPAIHGDGEQMRLLSRERGEVGRRLESLAAKWAEKAEQLEAAEES